LGGYDISDFGFSSIVRNLNKGVREALLLISQKDFTGRRIINIELDDDNIVIKGSK